MQICVAGCHTNVGKTYTSAMLCSVLKYDYFKIIQAGLPKDSEVIKKFSPNTSIYPEGILLQTPASPHIGMKVENISYDGLKISLPPSKNLIIETAGGLYTPIDSKNCMIDFIQEHKLQTILVGSHYLGSINHILLSINALKNKNIKILSLIISGDIDEEMDDFIKKQVDIKIIHLPFYNEANLNEIKNSFKEALKKSFNTSFC
ncbi:MULTISPECIES: dethiobiotin synthase [unclassified Helicobacter]|uniref:dethiobiotin synthase n=1 Tax=unclassified Helicobacter TaxID=2593540 RepID=UPI000CF03DD9|nr:MULTISPECIES: dethiobiotin synthase [unclassified Helicobacter]